MYLGNIENGQDYSPRSSNIDDRTKNARSSPSIPILRGTRGVGTFGGSEDHTAIMSSKPDQLQLWSYCPTRFHRAVDIDPQKVAFVIAVSGTKAEKTGDAMNQYNDASMLSVYAAGAYVLSLLRNMDNTNGELKPPTRAILDGLFPDVKLYNPLMPNLAEVIRQERAKLFGSPADDAFTAEGHARVRESITERIRSASAVFRTALPVLMSSSYLCDETWSGLEDKNLTIESLVERFEQFYHENEVIVPGVTDAFATGNYDVLGELVDWSHELTVKKLRNTTPETEWLPLWARGKVKTRCDAGESSEGGARITALAASAFGAGFGGACWALVRAHEAERFCKMWSEAYNNRFPLSAMGENPGQILSREFFVMRPGPGAHELT